MASNPYQAQAEDIAARLAVTTNPKLRRELAQRLEWYREQARRFEATRGKP